MRAKVGLKCEECGDINCSIYKNSKNTTRKLGLRKYCPRLKRHTLHREVKLKN